jgi:transcriptional regulator NrdR family protein
VKCPKCGAGSSVTETRAYEVVLLRRRRKCFNGHLFSTYEVHAGSLDRRTLAGVKRGVGEKAKAWRRKEYVRKNPATPSLKLATELGVTDSRVRQIRKELSRNGPSTLTG